MFTIRSNFIGDFKTGDNINYNLGILRVLYRHYGEAFPDEQNYLRKPITVLLVSIIEAMLADFYARVKSFTLEGVAGVEGAVIEDIRGKKLDTFGHFSANARKHKIFGDDVSVYEKLEALRKLRNRIHVQEHGGLFERDEAKAFSPSRMRHAESMLEYIGKHLSEKHARSKAKHDWVKDFECPWAEHRGSRE